MIVQPKQPFSLENFGFSDPESIVEVASDTPGDMFIECVVLDPPSSAGRTVTLHVPARQMVALMKAAKQHAIRTRAPHV